jgi:hypothetical protein
MNMNMATLIYRTLEQPGSNDLQSLRLTLPCRTLRQATVLSLEHGATKGNGMLPDGSIVLQLLVWVATFPYVTDVIVIHGRAPSAR